MIFVGADGCKAGWFTIALTENAEWEVDVFPDVFRLWDAYSDASAILIDILVGLRDKSSEERRCDIEARKLLGRPRGSSVFRAPCRVAIYAETYKKACDINEQRTGRQLSRQIWNITPKIREVDSLLIRHESARSCFRETHPEICFWALAGGHPMKHSKKTEAGFSERKQVLESVFPPNDTIGYALETYRRNQVEEDDILDALAAALTAKLGFQKGFVSLPDPPEFDSQGLRMEVVYCLKERLKT